MPKASKLENKPLTDPTVSVIIPTFQHARLGHVEQCITSLEEQTYDPDEIIIIADNTNSDPSSRTLFDYLNDSYGNNSLITVVPDNEKRSVTDARNEAVKHADGDVYAFIDDDAIAAPDWLENLAEGYKQGYPAVGGRAAPIWEASEQQPWTLPQEMWWLVGVTHRGFVDLDQENEEQEVRNTYACNFSVRAEVFDTLGGFQQDLGKDYGHNYQAEEAELGHRMRKALDKGTLYIPEALVHHKVFPIQQTLGYLLDRAFWQGFAKAQLFPDTWEEENEEFQLLFRDALPTYTKSDPLAALAILVLFFATGFGYAAGFTRRILAALGIRK